MIKLLYFITSLGCGGAETILKDYSLFLNKDIFDVEILVLDKYRLSPIEKILLENEIRISHIDKEGPFITKIFNKLFRTRRVINFFHKRRFDIIHTHLAVNTFLLKARKEIKNVKLFHTIHAPIDVSFFGNKAKKKERIAISTLVNSFSLSLICVQNEMKKYADNLFHTDSLVIYNCINLNRFFQFKYDKNEIIEFKKRIGIPEKSFVIGNIGRFTTAKNHEFLLEVFLDIHKLNSNAFLVLVGTGELLNQIEKKINELGLVENVLILSNRSDVPDILKTFDVFAFPSHYESFGIALIEAQASNIYCVCSNKVPKESIVLPNTTILELDNKDLWVKNILEKKHNDSFDKKLFDKFDIHNIVNQLTKEYLRCFKNDI